MGSSLPPLGAGAEVGAGGGGGGGGGVVRANRSQSAEAVVVPSRAWSASSGGEEGASAIRWVDFRARRPWKWESPPSRKLAPKASRCRWRRSVSGIMVTTSCQHPSALFSGVGWVEGAGRGRSEDGEGNGVYDFY